MKLLPALVIVLSPLLARADAVAQQSSAPSTTVAAQPTATSDQRALKLRAKRLAQYVVYIVLILLVFLTGTIAIVRFSRRYNRYLLNTPATPTQSEDVWAMHRVPEELMPPTDSTGGDRPA